ncbi:MAG: Dyp-type peroxidase [Actinomycetia bacterium]|nr:Dyp-type peroxidase [Actinomycetes bacterium]
MPETQEVLVPLPQAAIFLVVTVRDGAEEEVRDVLADLAGVARAVGFGASEAGLNAVVGVGSRLWDRLFPELPRPDGLHPFRDFVGDTHVAVGTPGDLLFHIRAARTDLCFETARRLVEQLGGSVDVVDEVHGFRYLDRRDLLGFVDGTENPTGQAASEAVYVPDGAPYAGGSYALVQKYVHDLDAWNALPTEEQELVIGRRKLSDTELSDDEKPTNSHVAANTIVDADGTEREIVRANMPFGSVGSAEFGTYFIAYAASPDVIEDMLENMFVGDPPGDHDRILDFSTAVTGGLFFVPPADFLEDQTVDAEDVTVTALEEPSPSDGSLGIGGLETERTES